MQVRAITIGTIAAMAGLLSGGVGLMMRDNRSPTTASQPRRISVRLLGPAEAIRGVTVPAHILAGERPRFFQVDEPSVVAVTLPVGKVIELPVKTALIVTQVDPRTRSITVVDIDLMPLLRVVPYREVVAEVRRFMLDMNIEPDERMRKKMAEWPADSGPVKYRASMDFNKECAITVEVRPAPDDGWYIVFSFEAGVEPRRALWDPTFKATGKPPSKENGKELDLGS